MPGYLSAHRKGSKSLSTYTVNWTDCQAKKWGGGDDRKLWGDMYDGIAKFDVMARENYIRMYRVQCFQYNNFWIDNNLTHLSVSFAIGINYQFDLSIKRDN